MKALAFAFVVATTVGGCISGVPTPVTTDQPLPSERGSHPLGFAAELQEYEKTLANICSTAPEELLRRYEALVKAMEAANYGFGRGSNFAGVHHPNLVRADCGD